MASMPSSPFQNLLPDWRARLEARMRAQNLTKRSLALRAGLGATTVSEWFNPEKNKQPSFSSLASVASALGVSLDEFSKENMPTPERVVPEWVQAPVARATVLGDLRAGSWQESNVNDGIAIKTAPTLDHPNFAGIEQFAWRIPNGLSGFAEERGSFVVGVRFEDIKRFRVIANDDLVVCCRKQGDLTESTLRRVRLTPSGLRLKAELSFEAHLEDIELGDDPHSNSKGAAATHLIIGSFQFLV